MPLLLVFFLVGCAVTEDAAEVEPAVLLGTGEWFWEPLGAGDPIAVIQGPQGGHHLLGSVRLVGLEAGDPENLGAPNNPTTTFSVLLDGVNLTPNATYLQGIDPVTETSSGWDHEMIGRFAILDIADDSELDGLTLRFEVEVEDINGRSASDGLEIVAYPDPRNE
jgi:hypothetical protein